MDKRTGFNSWAILMIAGVLIAGVISFLNIKNIYVLGLVFFVLLLALFLFFKLTSKEAQENREFEKLMKTPVYSARSAPIQNIDYLNDLFRKRLSEISKLKQETAPQPPVFNEKEEFTKSEETKEDLKTLLTLIEKVASDLTKDINAVKIEMAFEFDKIRKETIFVDKKALQ